MLDKLIALAPQIPLALMAISVPVLFRRAGHPPRVVLLSGLLPSVVLVFGWLAFLFGETGDRVPMAGAWMIAGAILALAAPWPRDSKR
ncbi:MAG: hypothetical protein R3C58_11795 [Parvularculaceae bacterium]